MGAFLLLLRYRGETPEELAGFVRAARSRLPARRDWTADLDWPSYADRHRQQPYFVLAAKLLAQNGVRILMHGIAGEQDGYAPTRPVLKALDLPICESLDEAAAALGADGFAYVGLDRFAPEVERLFHLRPLLGLRSVVNSFARAINPLGAAATIQGITHPPYRDLHIKMALILGQDRTVAFKGGGGEAQRNPLKPCRLAWQRLGCEAGEENWPALLPGHRFAWRDEPLDPTRVQALWRGKLNAPIPEAAIVGTVAIALWLLGRVKTAEEAHAMAERMWATRDPGKSSIAA